MLYSQTFPIPELLRSKVDQLASKWTSPRGIENRGRTAFPLGQDPNRSVNTIWVYYSASATGHSQDQLLWCDFIQFQKEPSSSIIPGEKHATTVEVPTKSNISESNQEKLKGHMLLFNPFYLVSNLQKMGRQCNQSHRGLEKENQQYTFFKKATVILSHTYP